MHAIVPLAPAATGASVVELHTALQVLQVGPPVPADERERQVYADGTTAAVAVLQREFGIAPEGGAYGVLDARTAHEINLLMLRRGMLNLVSGQLRSPAGRPVTGVRVAATDTAADAVSELGDVGAGPDGGYELFYASGATALGAVVVPSQTPIDLVVVVRSFSGTDLARSDPRHAPANQERIDITVPDAPVDLPVSADQFVVRGAVRDADGSPARAVTVTAWDRDLGERRDLLGRSVPDAEGSFSISYAQHQFQQGDVLEGGTPDGAAGGAAGGRARADIVFEVLRDDVAVPVLIYRVVDGVRAALPLTADDALLGIAARDDEQVDLVLTQAAPATGTEYERLLAALRPLLEEASPATLDEPRFRDVSFAARETGVDRTQLGQLVTAHQLAGNVFDGAVPAPLLYGLARSEQRLTDLARLTLADEAQLRAGIDQAVKDAIIPAQDAALVDGAIRRIRASAPQHVLSGAAGADGFAPVLDAAGLDRQHQDALVQAVAGRQDDASALWTALRDNPAFAEAGSIERAQFALQLDAFTERNVPLMTALQTDRGIASARHLLDLPTGDLAAVVKETGVPQGVPGADDDERATTYAQALLTHVHLAFPTASLARSIAAAPPDAVGGGAAQAAVGTVLSAATTAGMQAAGTAFDIRTSNVAAYLEEHGDDVLADVPEDDRPLVRPALERAQRLFRVSTGPESFDWLLASPHGTAFDIAQLSRATFLGAAAPVLGTTQALMMHSRALSTANAMLATYVNLIDARFGISPAFLGQDQAVDNVAIDTAVATYLPTWSELFGEISWCDCPDCRSVYSPAAYLVDLLTFLDAAAPNAQSKNPLDMLLSRRPDLAQLQLSCENTNTSIPYVDLVNEVLESLVVSLDPATIPAFDTEGASPAELAAAPQHTIWPAYVTPVNGTPRPDTAAYPRPLPYDAALATARRYSEHLGAPWRRVVKTFSAHENAITAERLGVNPTTFALITGVTVEGDAAAEVSLDERFGLTLPGRPRLDAKAIGWWVSALVHALAATGAALVPAADPGTQAFDAGVEAAVQAFQTAHGLPPAGIVDEATWTALVAAVAATGGTLAPWLLPDVPTLLDRAELSYDELRALLSMRFVNPAQAALTTLQALRLPSVDLLAFQTSGLTAASPALVAALTAHGVTLPEFTEWGQSHLVDEAWADLRASTLLDVPADGSGGLAAVTVRHWDDSAARLSAAEWLRLERLLRLQRALGWSTAQLDVVLEGLGAHELTPAVLSGLAQVADLAADLDLAVDQVAALWLDLDPTRPESLYHQRFRGRAARRDDPAFEPDWRGSVLNEARVQDHLPALQAGLRASGPELDAARRDAGLTGDAWLDLAGLSGLYRRLLLARALERNVSDVITLQRITGLDPFTAPGADWSAAAFVRAAHRLDDAGLDVPTLDQVTADHAAPAADPVGDGMLTRLRTSLLEVAAAADPAQERDGSQTQAALDYLGVPTALGATTVQILTGRYRTTVVLAGAPNPAPAIPPEWAARVQYSPLDTSLTVTEALTDAEQDAIAAFSADAGYVAAVQAAHGAPRTAWAELTAALAPAGITVPPVATVLAASLPAAADARESAVTARLQLLLAVLAPVVRDRRGRAVVAQAVAGLPLDPAVTALVLEGVRDGTVRALPAQDGTSPLVVDLLAVAAGAEGDSLPDPARQAYALLDVLRRLVDALGLLGADVVALVCHVVRLRANPAVLLTYTDVEAVLAYWQVRRRSTAATLPAQLWDSVDDAVLQDLVARIAAVAGDLVTGLLSPDGWNLPAAKLRDPLTLERAVDALHLVHALGVEVGVAARWAQARVDQDAADGLRRAVQTGYDGTALLKIVMALNDPLREQRRAALVGYLAPRLGVRGADGLYQALLIDVEMTPVVLTSRIKQAISSVQLFVQRILLNLEHGVAPQVVDREHWSWMQNYRVWEANRKVLLYPENWILPELRDDKTPFFRELEGALLGDELTAGNAERALRDYLGKLDEVAKLDIVALHVQRDFEPGEKLSTLVHLFGRTANTPRRVYYRRYAIADTGTATWTPWELVPLDVTGDLVTAVTFERRLYLFWAQLATKAKDASATSSSAQPPAYYQEISLAWAEYRHGAWGAKHMTDAGDVLVDDYNPNDSGGLDVQGQPRSPGIVERLETRVDGDVLRVLGIASRAILWTNDEKRISYEPGISLDGKPHDGNQAYTYSLGSFVLDDCHGKLAPVLTADQSWTEDGLVLGLGSGLAAKPLGSKPLAAIPVLALAGGGRLATEHWVMPRDGFAVFSDARRAYLAHVSVVTRPLWDVIAVPQKVFPALTAATKHAAQVELSTDIGLIAVQQAQQQAEEAKHSWASASAVLGGVAVLQAASPTEGVTFAPTAPAIGNGLGGGNAVPVGGHLLPHTGIDTAVIVAGEAGRIGRSKMLTEQSVDVSFELLFDPFVCTYLKRLEQAGVDGVLTLANQQLSFVPAFATKYLPKAAIVRTPYPTDQVDFGATAKPGLYRSTAQSTYNWELFFHIPMLIGTRLQQDQRFEEALSWFHHVFDPTDGTGGYWKVLPLQTVPQESVQGWLERLNAGDADLKQQIADWKDHPFQPHFVARMRLSAYQKYVVMTYLDTVIAWADALYDRETLESINQATQLYLLAAEVLGALPQRLPLPGEPAPQTFAQLRGRLDALGNAAVEFENVFPTVSATTVMSSSQSVGLLGMGRSLYFCIPPNDKLLGYWDAVAQRLFNIRHSLNRAGVFRQLPLFEPPIDPALLVRAAAQGLSLDSVLADLATPLPKQRFEHVLRRANDACADLKALGSQLLTALERRDAEQLEQLRASHETAALQAILDERVKQEANADAQIDAVATSRAVPVERLRYLHWMTGAEDRTPQPGEILPMMSYAPKPQAQAGTFLIPEESQELDSLHSARDWQVRSTVMEIAASLAHYIPTFTIALEPWGVGTELSFGGDNVGPALTAISRYLGSLGAQDTYDATHAGKMAVYRRRGQDFAYQANIAALELADIDKQVTLAQIGKELATLQREHAEQQLAQAQETEQQLRSKYTNNELYGWLIGQLGSVYFRTYQLALSLAKQAERCYRFERSIEDSSIIQFGTWDNLRKGLLASEQLQLQLQLRQLERAHADADVRELELTKHVSLLQHAPMALIALKERGSCEVDLPEWLFDLDYPGHYLRRIKSVGVTVPTVVGPYATVNATLTLLGNETRMVPSLRGGKYERDRENTDERFVDDYAAVQQIATSGGLNDSGLFELDFRDPRYLPFEGAGAAGRWRITLDPDCNAFDMANLTDVVLHLRYTARDGGEQLRTAAKTRRAAVLADAEGLPLQRLFSLKHEFPSEWYRLVNVTENDGRHEQTVQLSRDRFPLLFGRAKVTIGAIEMFGVSATGTAPTKLPSVTTPQQAPVVLTPGAPVGALLHETGTVSGVAVLDGDAAGWHLSVASADAASLAQLDDVIILCHFRVTA